MDCHFEQDKKLRKINVWNAIANLQDDRGVTSEDLLNSFMGWQGDHDVREWIIGRVEKDYDVTFDDDGNMTTDEE